MLVRVPLQLRSLASLAALPLLVGACAEPTGAEDADGQASSQDGSDDEAEAGEGPAESGGDDDDSDDDGETDAAGETGTPEDPPRCDPNAAFSAMVWLDELNAIDDAGTHVGRVWPMPDELSLWVDIDWQIMELTRASVDEPFGDPQPVAGLEHASQNRYSVSLSPDGLRAYFQQSTPDVFNTEHPETAARDAIDEPFSETWALALGHPDARVFSVRRAAEQLFYLQAAEGTPTRLWVEDLANDTVSEVLSLEAEHAVAGYATTADALTVFFTDRFDDEAGEQQRRTLWTVRESTDDRFLPPIAVDGVAELVPEFTVYWVSDDRCVLYGSDRDSGHVLTLRRG